MNTGLIRVLLGFITVALSVQVVAFGQGGVGSTRGLPTTSGGTHTIQGKVHFPGGRPSKRLTVRLNSNLVSQSVQTDSDGAFRFNQLEAGPYTITVEGDSQFETAVENVSIEREVSSYGRTLSVPVFLKLKPDVSVPPPAVEAYQKAQQFERTGNPKKAIEQLNAALAIYPQFTLAMSQLGSLYLKTGEMEKASEALTKLVQLTPGDISAQQNLGIALFNQKKVQEAEAPLREAIKLNDKLPTAHYYLGLVLVNLKAYADAEKELELAISNGGENLALAHKYLGGLYMGSKKNQQAADELEKYLKLDPKAPDAERIKGTIKDLRSRQ